MEYGAGTALVVVDVQNDFSDPRGGLYVAGGEEVVPLINAQIRAALAAGSPVVFTQDWHPPDTPHFIKDGGVWPTHCVAGTWGAELHPGLEVPQAAEVVRKGVGGEDGYSGFTLRDPLSGETASTGLAELLAERGVNAVVVVGIATDVCVLATALDAARLGFRTAVLPEATRPVERAPGDADRALAEMRAGGVILG